MIDLTNISLGFHVHLFSIEFHLAIYAYSLSKKARKMLQYWVQNHIRLSKLNVAAKFNVIDRKCVTLAVMKGRVLFEMFPHPALMRFQQLVKAKHICTNLRNLVHFKSKRLSVKVEAIQFIWFELWDKSLCLLLFSECHTVSSPINYRSHWESSVYRGSNSNLHFRFKM